MMLTPKEASQISHIGINRIRELSRRRDFPALRVGRKILIHEEEFNQWLRTQVLTKSATRY